MNLEPIREQKFSKLNEWAEKFAAEDGLSFLIVYGPPGLAKSQSFKRCVRSKAVIEGKLTGIAMYEKLWAYKGLPIVFDDVDALLKDKDTLNLLKLLGNTDPVKTVQWNSNSQILTDQGIPKQFKTTSRIAIICNSVEKLGKSLPAVLDRAITVEFVPTIAEIHAEAGRWLEDREVFDFIGARLEELTALSLRTYVKAAEMKRVGAGDWKTYALQSCGVNLKMDAALRVMKDPALKTLQQRVALFEALGGGSKATFCRYQQELRDRHPELAKAEENDSTEKALVAVEE